MSKTVVYTIPGTANTPAMWVGEFNKLLGSPDALQPSLEALVESETSRGMPSPDAMWEGDVVVMKITVEVVERPND